MTAILRRIGPKTIRMVRELANHLQFTSESDGPSTIPTKNFQSLYLVLTVGDADTPTHLRTDAHVLAEVAKCRMAPQKTPIYSW